MRHEEGFRCIEGCVRCCTDSGNPLELTIGDMLRISKRLSMNLNHFFESYCEIIWNKIPDTYLLIPSIGLVFPCRFLDNGRCSVYALRPIHCRLFPEAIVAEKGNLGIYRNCGYQCIDKGMAIDNGRKDYMLRLKRTDLKELEITAAYLDNFKYCVAVKPQEFHRINRLVSDVADIEKAGEKRELLKGAITEYMRDEVVSVFIEKLNRLDREFGEKLANETEVSSLF